MACRDTWNMYSIWPLQGWGHATTSRDERHRVGVLHVLCSMYDPRKGLKGRRAIVHLIQYTNLFSLLCKTRRVSHPWLGHSPVRASLIILGYGRVQIIVLTHGVHPAPQTKGTRFYHTLLYSSQNMKSVAATQIIFVLSCTIQVVSVPIKSVFYLCLLCCVRVLLYDFLWIGFYCTMHWSGFHNRWHRCTNGPLESECRLRT